MSFGPGCSIEGADLERLLGASTAKSPQQAGASSASTQQKTSSKRKDGAAAAARTAGGSSSTTTNDCPLSALLASLASTAEERRRLESVNPEWMNVALKGEGRSSAGRALRSVAKQRERAANRRVEAAAAVSSGAAQRDAKAAERMAHRMGGVASPTTSTNGGPSPTAFPSPAASPSARSLATTDFSAVSFVPVAPKRSGRALRRWARLSTLRCERSRLVRCLSTPVAAKTARRSTASRLRRGLSKAVRRSVRMAGAVAIVAATLESTRDAFVRRLEGQRLPSSMGPTAASATNEASPAQSSSPTSTTAQQQRVSPALACLIASRCLPLVGASVTIAAVNTAARRARRKGCAAKTVCTSASISSSFVGHSGVVVHETERMACVALRRSLDPTHTSLGAAGPDAFSGRLISVRKSHLRLA